MKLEHRKIILLGIFLFVVPFVLGANVIENIIGPLGLENIPGLYVKYPTFFDAVFYFMFFIGISLAGLGRMEMFQNSKLVPVTVGIILALAMSVFSYNRFSLIGDLGPYALIFVILFCFFFGYKALIGMGTNKLIAFAILYLVLSAIFMFAISPLLSGSKTGQNSAVQAMSGNETIQSVAALGNVVSWFILIGALFGLVFKRRDDGPSSAETADLKTYFPKGEAAAENIEKVDDELEKTTKDKGEKELLEEAKEETKLEEDSEVPIAEAKKTSDALESEKKIEETTGKLVEQALEAAANDSTTIESALARAGAPNVDAVLPAYIINYLRRVVNIGQLLGTKQKEAIDARITLLNSTLENVKRIDDILKRTKRAERYLTYIEKKVAKDMGQEVLQHVRDELKKIYAAKKRSQDTFNATIKTASPEMRASLIENQKKTMADFKRSIQTMEINESHIRNTIDIFIKQYMVTMTKTINEIKKIVSDQITFEQDLKKKVNNAYSDAKQYDAFMKKLETAVEKLNGQIARIQQQENQKDVVIEGIIAEANAGVTEMFSSLLEINNHTIRLFQNDILPLLDDFKRMDIQASQLGASITELNKGSLQIQTSYENLKKAVSFDKTGQSDNINKILIAINTLSNTAAQERQQVITQTISQMDKTKADVQNELNKMAQENQHLGDKQRKVMSSLDNAMKTLAGIRKKEGNTITNASDKMNVATAQAAQNLQAANVRLENVNFK